MLTPSQWLPNVSAIGVPDGFGQWREYAAGFSKPLINRSLMHEVDFGVPPEVSLLLLLINMWAQIVDQTQLPLSGRTAI
jgi:hypothetical protein